MKIQEELLETIVSKYYEDTENKLYILIMIIYEDMFSKNNTANFIISDLLKPVLRCFDKEKREWSNCPDGILSSKQEEEIVSFEKLQTNPSGFYLILEKSGEYKIRKVMSTRDILGTGNTISRGQKCSTMKISFLLTIISYLPGLSKSYKMRTKDGKQISTVYKSSLLPTKTLSASKIMKLKTIIDMKYFGEENRELLENALEIQPKRDLVLSIQKIGKKSLCDIIFDYLSSNGHVFHVENFKDHERIKSEWIDSKKEKKEKKVRKKRK